MSDSRVPILAVLVGRSYGVYYFFNNSGQLMADTGIPTVLFSIADFASPSEIQPLADFIPKDRHVLPIEVADKYQPPPALGAHLLEKLSSFSNKSSLVYQRSMTDLSAASEKLPWETEFRTMSLHEVAGVLVPKAANSDGEYDPALLYAIHKALLDDETDAFRSLNQISSGKHASYLYRVAPASTINAILKVRYRVRGIMQQLGSKYALKERPKWIDNNLWRFIVKARHVVKLSREQRAVTDHGMLAPHHDRYLKPRLNWSPGHEEVIRFIELWASRHFSQGSVLHSMGSAILRLTGMYGQGRPLDATTGWTFLQELGWVPSWEVSTRHRLPLPGASVRPGGGYIRPDPGPYKESMRNDIAAAYRKDWGPLKAYCIDAPQSTLLDDAISLEPAETPGEHWIHVHTADPSAFIDPHSKLAEFTAIVAMDHYLPGYRLSMFPQDFFDEVIMKQLSLENGRPCLTFSTKLNEAGEVLDTKVQAGTLQNVAFISPDELNKVCSPKRVLSVDDEPGPQSLYVGPRQDVDSTPTRKMLTAEDLSPEERTELQTMQRLLWAVEGHREERGAVQRARPSRSMRSVRVMFDYKGDPTPEDCSPNAPSWPGDPAIEVSIEEQVDGTLVPMAMTLAGESAAKWCHARGIPVPYHVQPGALRSSALRLLAEKVRELVQRGELVPKAIWDVYDLEAGPSAMAVDPSPVVSMGMDMYTKVTSPLRRLSDCITHWQIHSYLSQHQQAAAAPAAADPSRLPWARDALHAKLDALRLSTYTSRTLNRYGTQQWAHQALLRAWKFGEADIPRTFPFVVRDVYTNLLHGDLGFLRFRAVLPKRELDGVALMKEVAPGDALEVEITDVDAYRCVVKVRALGRMGREATVDAVDVFGEADAPAAV